jgi:hypothetical protein
LPEEVPQFTKCLAPIWLVPKMTQAPFRTLISITCRTVQGRFLFRPGPQLNSFVLGVLGRAQRRYETTTSALSVLSSHFHLLLVVDDAREKGAMSSWCGPAFSASSEYESVSPTVGADVALACPGSLCCYTFFEDPGVGDGPFLPSRLRYTPPQFLSRLLPWPSTEAGDAEAGERRTEGCEVKISKRSVDALRPDGSDQIHFDGKLAGFGVRVSPAGAKSYLVQYRRDGRTRRLALGKVGELTSGWGDVGSGGRRRGSSRRGGRPPAENACPALT